VAVVVHPSNTFAQSITIAELRKLWRPEAEQQVRLWSQIRAGWPDTEVHLFGPGVESGTYDFFTEAVVGKEGASRGDFTSSEDDNVLVQGVSHDPGALGFFGFGYYEENIDQLKLVAIDDERPENGDGPTLPSPKSILDGSYEPLSRPVFVYVSRASADRPEVRELVSYYLQQTALIDEVGYVPLSPRALTLVKERWSARTVGSLFAGHEAHGGGSVEALLER
jgi:phosphate transport system substrate-binding protein